MTSPNSRRRFIGYAPYELLDSHVVEARHLRALEIRRRRRERAMAMLSCMALICGDITPHRL